ncbi:MAG TPA: cytochrome c oxidase subunit 3 [Gemmataceae bacterium]|jgi:cytochrome c oxidase subunit 3|nr:cytochrome c oxidase subunit 3 [Gemmataceae bacterium]
MSASVGALRHHFEDIEQQRGAERLGMWMFLATEILFFGGAFLAYTVYRLMYPKDFAAISGQLNVLIAGINTVLLLTSSLTMTLAIRAAQYGHNGPLRFYLGVSILLGSAFMGFKAYEYAQDYHEGLVPWTSNFGQETLHGDSQPLIKKWEADGVAPQRVRLFMSFYFILTGIHGVHLVVGIGVISYLWVRAYLKTLTPDKYVAVEVTSLYWHLVDAIWLFLMPLLYLAGPHHSLHF